MIRHEKWNELYYPLKIVIFHSYEYYITKNRAKKKEKHYCFLKWLDKKASMQFKQNEFQNDVDKLVEIH